MNDRCLTFYSRQLFCYVASLTSNQKKVFYAAIQLPIEDAVQSIGPLLGGIFEASQNPSEQVHWIPAKPEELING